MDLPVFAAWNSVVVVVVNRRHQRVAVLVVHYIFPPLIGSGRNVDRFAIDATEELRRAVVRAVDRFWPDDADGLGAAGIDLFQQKVVRFLYGFEDMPHTAIGISRIQQQILLDVSGFDISDQVGFEGIDLSLWVGDDQNIILHLEEDL